MEFALGFMIFLIGAVAGALIASAFIVDRHPEPSEHGGRPL